MGKSTINIYKWPFSIAMLNYQRVTSITSINSCHSPPHHLSRTQPPEAAHSPVHGSRHRETRAMPCGAKRGPRKPSKCLRDFSSRCCRWYLQWTTGLQLTHIPELWCWAQTLGYQSAKWTNMTNMPTNMDQKWLQLHNVNGSTKKQQNCSPVELLTSWHVDCWLDFGWWNTNNDISPSSELVSWQATVSRQVCLTYPIRWYNKSEWNKWCCAHSSVLKTTAFFRPTCPPRKRNSSAKGLMRDWQLQFSPWDPS